MPITTLTSRQFDPDASRAKKAARRGPVVIIDRGKAAHVLTTFQDDERPTSEHRGDPVHAGTLARSSDRQGPGRRCRPIKERVNAIALAPVEDFRRDSDLFGEGASKPEAVWRFQAALKHGFQTRDAENGLGRVTGRVGQGGRVMFKKHGPE